MKDIYTAIGTMSGTSADGVDAGIIKTDGDKITSYGEFVYLPYTKKESETIKSAFGIDTRIANEDEMKLVKKVEKIVEDKHIKAVKELLKKASLTHKDIDVIGYHGQTIFHKPDEGFTSQISNPQRIANETGILTVGDTRQNDVKNGGEGAPLITIYHRAIMGETKKPIAVLNIGGVSNVSFIHGENLVALDTGPGNAILNDWINKHTGEEMDKDGKIASSGKVNKEMLANLMQHPYFKKAYPKSLDRNDFNKYCDEHIKKDISLEDGAATITEFTVQSIAHAMKSLPEYPEKLVVCGGGAFNPYMMKRISETCNTNVTTIEKEGKSLDSSRIEADGFGLIAVRTLLNRPSSFPGTTHCKTPTVCGKIYKPNM